MTGQRTPAEDGGQNSLDVDECSVTAGWQDPRIKRDFEFARVYSYFASFAADVAPKLTYAAF